MTAGDTLELDMLFLGSWLDADGTIGRWPWFRGFVDRQD